MSAKQASADCPSNPDNTEPLVGDAKRLQLFTRLLEIGLLRPRLKGTAKYFLGIFFVDKKGKTTKRLILDARVMNWAFASPSSVNLLLLCGDGPQ